MNALDSYVKLTSVKRENIISYISVGKILTDIWEEI